MVKALLAQQLAVDHAHGTNLDDGVPLLGVKAGGFGVKHGKHQLTQGPVFQFAGLFAALEQVKVIELGPLAGCVWQVGCKLLRGRICQGQQKTKQGLVAHPVALKPHLAAVALHHVAHGERRRFAPHAHGVHFPAHHGFVAHGLAGPHHIELRVRALSGQAQLQKAHAEFIHQPGSQVAQCLQQGEAVHAQPERRVHAIKFHRAAAARSHVALRGSRQIGTAHVFQRPTRLQTLGAARSKVGHTLCHAAHLIADDRQKALAHGRFQIGKRQHVHRRLQVGQRGAAAFGQAVQQLALLGIGFHAGGHVVQHQHKAGNGGSRLGLGAHRRHLHPQQLPAQRRSDQLRCGPGIATRHGLLNALKGMRQDFGLQHRVDRAANADQLRAFHCLRLCGQFPKSLPCALVVEQDAARRVAHQHALLQLGHQRGEAVFFILHMAAGLRHLGGHVSAQCIALGRQFIDSQCQRPHFARAPGFELLRPFCREHHTGFPQQAHGRANVATVQHAHDSRDCAEPDQPANKHQAGSARQHIADGGALGLAQGGPDNGGHQHQPQRHHQPGNRDGRPEARVAALHGCSPASICATRSTSSRVAKGLVM